MDMSSLANVRSITSAPGAVTTYDERGNRVITNASLKNGNGTPVSAYSMISGTTPYSMKNDYRNAIDRWARSRALGKPTTLADVRIVRDLLSKQGYDVSNMSDDEVMTAYLSDIKNKTYGIDAFKKVTGRAGDKDGQLFGTGLSPSDMARNPNVSRDVTRHFDNKGRRIAVRNS